MKIRPSFIFYSVWLLVNYAFAAEPQSVAFSLDKHLRQRRSNYTLNSMGPLILWGPIFKFTVFKIHMLWAYLCDLSQFCNLRIRKVDFASSKHFLW